MNPTKEVLEKRIAALEGGVMGLTVSSGQSAEFMALHIILLQGDNFLASYYLYGGTYNQFKVTFKLLVVETLSLGVQRMVDNALALTQRLAKHRQVEYVHYLGLESNK